MVVIGQRFSHYPQPNMGGVYDWFVQSAGPRIGHTNITPPPIEDSFSYLYNPKCTCYGEERCNVLTMFHVNVDDVG